MDGNAHQVRRRLSAVLCADVVGYSAHMMLDERATHVSYKTCLDEFVTPLISAHFGKLVKSTGDGFFARFDSVIAAMECALAIQSELPGFQEQNDIVPALKFRLGVNAGDVIAEEEDIYGNDVNLAARLQQQSRPGGICITAGTFEQVNGKLAAVFEDLGQITFKNEVYPTHVYACFPEGHKLSQKKTWTGHLGHCVAIARQKRLAIASSAVVALAITVGGSLAVKFESSSPLEYNASEGLPIAAGIPDERPSVAVLAFENLSQLPETQALSLGVGETIATSLAASQRFFVTDPKSSLEFSSSDSSLQNIARRLNVRFLLLGNVNQIGEKIRVNVRLVDTRTGRNHWADSILEDIHKVFDIEDRITNKVIASLSEGPLAPAGKGIRGATRNIAAYRSFLKGWQLLKTKPVPDFNAAIPLLEQAVLHDPKYGNAHSALADAYIAKSYHVFQSFVEEGRAWDSLKENGLSDMWIAREDYLDKARTYLSFAMREPTAYAYRISSQMNYMANDHEAAARDARNAYLRDPNNADSAAEFGLSLIWNGHTDDGVKEIRKAIRINPNGEDRYRAYLGIGKFIDRQYNAALADFESALTADPHNGRTLIHMIASYGHLDNFNKARQLIKQMNKGRAKRGLAPAYIQRIMRKMPYKHQSDRLHLAAGLHKAGMKYGVGHLTED